MADHLALRYVVGRVALYQTHLNSDPIERRRRDELWLREKTRLWAPLFYVAELCLLPFRLLGFLIHTPWQLLWFVVSSLAAVFHWILILWWLTFLWLLPVYGILTKWDSFVTSIHSPLPMCPVFISGWSPQERDLVMAAQDMLSMWIPFAFNGSTWYIPK